MLEQPAIKSRADWLAAVLALCNKINGLTRYARIPVIREALFALYKERFYFHEDLTISTDPGDVVVMYVTLRRYSSGERLQEALAGLKAEMITEVRLKRIGKGGRCQVSIYLAPRPPEPTV